MPRTCNRYCPSSGLITASCLISLLILLLTPVCSAQYEDARCKCVCSRANSTDHQRHIWIDNVSADQCLCENVVKPKSGPPSKVYCAQCDCKYENRNTTTIKVVVGLIITVITCLLLYMVFLVILRPLVTKQGFLGHSIMGKKNFARSVLVEEMDDVADVTRKRTSVRTSSSEVALSTDLPTEELHLASSSTAPRSRSRSDTVTEVVQRARDQQERWHKAVEEQRHRVYKNHVLLN